MLLSIKTGAVTSPPQNGKIQRLTDYSWVKTKQNNLNAECSKKNGKKPLDITSFTEEDKHVPRYIHPPSKEQSLKVRTTTLDGAYFFKKVF